MPLSGDGVLLKQARDPLLTLGLAFTRRLPLSLLEEELLVGGLRLVLVVDGACHVLPQPATIRQWYKRVRRNVVKKNYVCMYFLLTVLRYIYNIGTVATTNAILAEWE